MTVLKGMQLDDETLRQCVWLLLHSMGLHTTWRPVEELRRLGAIRTLLFLVGTANSWSGGAKMEIVKISLEVCNILYCIKSLQKRFFDAHIFLEIFTKI